MWDIIIIGAGPAGLTAAIYASRASKKVLVLEKMSYGGQIINTPSVENYPGYENISGFDLATNLYNQAKKLGAQIKFEEVINIDEFKKVTTSKETYQASAIILATGAYNRKLGITDEKELIGKGVSYCATCDGGFYKEKNVAVVGGGNTALEEALYLSDICNKVYLIHRRDEFRAENTLIDKLKEKTNVEYIYNSNVTKLLSVEKLKGIEITNNDGDKKTIEIDGLFIAIGRIPENEKFDNIIKLDENGYIKATEDCHTNIEGIFVAGDNRTKELRQLVTATSDGAVAASEAIKYISRRKNV